MTESIHDAFISYAHADDKVPNGAEFGWVTTFVKQLTGRLGSKLGISEPRIWMDHRLAANDQVTDTLLETLRQSRTLVLFMSRGYSRSEWCQRELGNFLENNQAHKGKENIFIVELDRIKRESLHPRLQELTPIRFWREGPDQIPELLGIPVPKPDQDDPYWRNLNRLAHLIANHLETMLPSAPTANPLALELTTPPKQKTQPIVWLAEPTDDLIDPWETLAEAIRQAGVELRPLGLDTYLRGSEAEYLNGLSADLEGAHLFVQLLGHAPGRRPKNGATSFTALQSTTAGGWAKQRQLGFLQWRSQELKLENIADERYREILRGAIACGFEEFRQRVLTVSQQLLEPAIAKPDKAGESLTICINANKTDRDLGCRLRDMLLELGADALTAPIEPNPGQTPTEFNAQLDEVLIGSEGVIIVYGQTTPAWVQAQYMRARKALAQRRRGLWGALLDGPPREKPEHGVASRNLMLLDWRDGPQRSHIEQFVDALRGPDHA